VGQQLKDPKNFVIATARNTAGSSGLQKLKAEYPQNDRLILLDLDVSSVESIRAAVKTLEPLLPNGLDNLLSNAGVSYNSMKTFEELYVSPPVKSVKFVRLLLANANTLSSI
jgi:NAD(P)-dependent dehydrogenase (short-subunit alcohol dehydrogenase family)